MENNKYIVNVKKNILKNSKLEEKKDSKSIKKNFTNEYNDILWLTGC